MEYLILFLILLIIHPYTTYPLILLLSKIIKCKHNIEELGKEHNPSVSLLISAYNEEKVIGEKIRNSLSLIYEQDKLQIVIGSDGSSDNTNEIVREYTKEHGNIKLLDYKERRGKVNVINDSIKYCTGEIIILSDANAMYNQEAIKNICSHFLNPKVGCVAGEKRMFLVSKNDSIGKNEGLYWKLEAFIKEKESCLSTVIGADGALYAIRKNLYQRLPSDTAVDDFLLSMLIVKQGYKIEYEPNAYSYELSAPTLHAEFLRKVRIAAGNFSNVKYLTSFINFNFNSFLFISHKLLRWISPLFFLFLTLALILGSIQNFYFRWMLGGLVTSYFVAYVGYYCENLVKCNKIISLITHFYLTVFAQLYGFIKYVNKSQRAIWDTVR